MSKVKKIFAILLSLAMIMGMSMTTFAANGTPQKADKADVKISGITGTPTITLYQIAKAVYGNNDSGLKQYEWAQKVTFADPTKPTANEINAIAQGLVKQTITPFATLTDTNVADGTYTKNVSAGAYIAIITGASDDSVYNPILLTASYDQTGNLAAGAIDATKGYLWGTSAVAKKTTPTIDKTVSGTTQDTDDTDRNTASVGDVLDYTLTPTMPSYPANATNKTFFISDTMTAGLTFDYASLTVEITGQTVTKDGNSFKLGNKVIATSAKTTNGFNLNFSYDNLISNATTGATYVPVVKYQAVVNANAVVGSPGNANTAEMYYANNPNNGSTWTSVDDKPGSASETVSKEDTQTVYTYQLAFTKTGENNAPLANAVFGIYTDNTCTKLVDTVTTNANGYAVSTNVASGTYYVKEIAAPTGYSLNSTVYSITASWNTATKTVNGTVVDRTYTTTKPNKDSIQVGWIKDNTFYSMSTFKGNETGVAKAYVSEQNTTTTTAIEITGNTAGAGTSLLATSIPNTRLSQLPSTGGIGTTIFTIGGCIIMIVAAGLFFASRKKK